MEVVEITMGYNFHRDIYRVLLYYNYIYFCSQKQRVYNVDIKLSMSQHRNRLFFYNEVGNRGRKIKTECTL